MPEGTCSVAGCDNTGKLARGWCNTHYLRWRKYGDPNAIVKAAATPAVDLPDGRRVCKRCGIPQELEQFDVDRRSKTGRRADCKTCRGSYMKTYYVNNADSRKQYMRERLASNPDHVRALDSARYIRDKDRRVALATEASHVRRSRILGREHDEGITAKRLRKIHGDRCVYCGTELDFGRYTLKTRPSTQATIEHIIPIARGGTHTWTNCTLACLRCNLSKNSRTVDEWEHTPSQGGSCDTAKTARVAGSTSVGSK